MTRETTVSGTVSTVTDAIPSTLTTETGSPDVSSSNPYCTHGQLLTLTQTASASAYSGNSVGSTATATSSGPAGYSPLTTSSSSVAGAVGATGTGAYGTGYPGYGPSNNGSFSSPTATVAPFMGSATATEYDARMLFCCFVAVVGAVLLV